MKNISMIVWLTQLGLSVAVPLTGFILLGVWLHNALGWGIWVILVGAALGLISAIEGFRSSLKAMKALSEKKEEDKPVSFNDHV